MNQRILTLTPVAAALALALALGACGRKDDTSTAGQKVDGAVAKVEQKTESMTKDIKEKAGEAGDKVAAVAKDAAITAEVNAELAKDNSLSAMKIDVDTSQGKVVLRGTAPDAAARERATRIAANVKGVGSVENYLTVEAKTSS